MLNEEKKERAGRKERVGKRINGVRTKAKRVSFGAKAGSNSKAPSLIMKIMNPFTSPMTTDESEEMIETRRILSSRFRRDAM